MCGEGSIWICLEMSLNNLNYNHLQLDILLTGHWPPVSFPALLIVELYPSHILFDNKIKGYNPFDQNQGIVFALTWSVHLPKLAVALAKFSWMHPKGGKNIICQLLCLNVYLPWRQKLVFFFFRWMGKCIFYSENRLMLCCLLHIYSDRRLNIVIQLWASFWIQDHNGGS